MVPHVGLTDTHPPLGPSSLFHFWPWIFHSIFLYPSFTDRGGGRRSGASSRFSQWGRHVSPWLCRVSPCVSQHLLPLTENWVLSTQTWANKSFKIYRSSSSSTHRSWMPTIRAREVMIIEWCPKLVSIDSFATSSSRVYVYIRRHLPRFDLVVNTEQHQHDDGKYLVIYLQVQYVCLYLYLCICIFVFVWIKKK